MKPILEVQHIGKKYRIQHLAGGYLSLRERMSSAFKFQRDEVEDFWALKDVSFDVQAGESIGIIGRNGAGKSTLLKILSKITPPTTGRIVSRGRVASLLEVGTGFHPELTGRENIFFNGSLLGMRRKEIENKFDEIVDFSGVEKFLDTPLKHYSSGMQLRLAFAVAAFLEPEILIIDEVLAVGDAEFQKKCLGKMEDVTKSGRTILFVSHDLAAVEKLCERAILLQSGNILCIDKTAEVISNYLYRKPISVRGIELSPGVQIASFVFGEGRIRSNADISFSISLFFEKDRPLITEFCLQFYSLMGTRVAILDLRDYLGRLKWLEGEIQLSGVLKRLNFVEGEYQIALHYAINHVRREIHDLVAISVFDDSETSVRKYLPIYRGIMELEFKIN